MAQSVDSKTSTDLPARVQVLICIELDSIIEIFETRQVLTDYAA